VAISRSEAQGIDGQAHQRHGDQQGNSDVQQVDRIPVAQHGFGDEHQQQRSEREDDAGHAAQANLPGAFRFREMPAQYPVETPGQGQAEGQRRQLPQDGGLLQVGKKVGNQVVSGVGHGFQVRLAAWILA
jgi:hypothetical protein